MASSRYILILIFVALPAVALATDYVVGDSKGWAFDINYQAWAADKTFFVGDKLVFKYLAGAHNVYKVTGAEFANCTVPSQGGAPPLTSGNDVVVLTTPGRKWYMCGVADHCARDQKLVITVLPDFPFAPTPSPWN